MIFYPFVKSYKNDSAYFSLITLKSCFEYLLIHQLGLFQMREKLQKSKCALQK